MCCLGSIAWHGLAGHYKLHCRAQAWTSQVLHMTNACPCTPCMVLDCGCLLTCRLSQPTVDIARCRHAQQRAASDPLPVLLRHQHVFTQSLVTVYEC